MLSNQYSSLPDPAVSFKALPKPLSTPSHTLPLQYDERLKEVRRKEREFMTMQKLKQRSEDLCNRCEGSVDRKDIRE